MILALGVGMMGMSPADIYALELREFFSAYQGWLRNRELDSRGRWEIARWSTGIGISPHIKDNKPIRELLPLPWDKKPTSDEELTMEQRYAQAAELLKYLNYNEQEACVTNNQD